MEYRSEDRQIHKCLVQQHTTFCSLLTAAVDFLLYILVSLALSQGDILPGNKILLCAQKEEDIAQSSLITSGALSLQDANAAKILSDGAANPGKLYILRV